ncbi:serine protease AprX [Marinithermofilum abyssi]|uniref:Serine protease AprX n=1 Tax=Marinithermofilum abyssi TaxID=1571185 RepID=A0A8J2YE82_9BACL|nr:S8 family peptidase [Marinithermofilum abyssi]GGE19017.1 serine protease AprX [Marinithermofilum abyssi]
MYQSHIQWIRDNGRRMDSLLRSSLIHRLRFLRWVPCVLHGTVIQALHRLSRARVLVQLDPEAAGRLQLTRMGVGSTYYSSIHTYRLNVSLSQLQELMGMPEVKKVYLDRKVYALLDTAVPATGAPKVWKGSDVPNFGENAAIAIIDTGIHPHPDLTRPQNRIIAFKDFVKGKSHPYDDNGHGTHVAGACAGNGFSSKGKYKGTAPNAKLVGIKVLNKSGSGNLSDVIAGVQWCIDNKDKYGIRVINLSLGSRTGTSYKDDPVAQIVEQAWKAGITVVAAAGNEGPESNTISSPGIHPQIITVGASDNKNSVDRNDDEIAPFSSRGPTADGVVKPDLLAPGTNITSLRVIHSYIDKMSPHSRVNQYYTVLSGTSMATPIVAGIVALLLTKNPNWTPDQVKQALISTAEDLGLPPNTQGSGHVQANLANLKE